MPLTLEQHAIRRRGIGASEIAAVVGLSKWSRPIDVWQSKVGATQPSPATPATERGDFLEPALREWYSYRFDRQVALSDTLQHSEHPIVLATPDGISNSPRGDDDAKLLEIKSPGRYTQHDWGDDATDAIPLYYLPQVTWAMAVTGLTSSHVVALVHGEMRCYSVDFDVELFDELLGKAQRFWDEHVVKNRPPPVEGSKSYADYLARRFKRAADDAVVVKTKQIADYMTTLARAQGRLKLAEYDVEKARNNIKAILRDRDRGECDLGHVTWRCNKDSEKTDWRAAALAAGATKELIAAHTKTVPGSRVFRASLLVPGENTGEVHGD